MIIKVVYCKSNSRVNHITRAVKRMNASQNYYYYVTEERSEDVCEGEKANWEFLLSQD